MKMITKLDRLKMIQVIEILRALRWLLENKLVELTPRGRVFVELSTGTSNERP